MDAGEGVEELVLVLPARPAHELLGTQPAPVGVLDAGHGPGRGDLLLGALDGLLNDLAGLRVTGTGLGVDPEVEGLAHGDHRRLAGVEDVLEARTRLRQSVGAQGLPLGQLKSRQDGGGHVAGGVPGVHGGLHGHEDLAVGALEPLDELGKERDELDLLAPVLLGQAHGGRGGRDDLGHRHEVLLGRQTGEGAGDELDALLSGLGRCGGRTAPVALLLRHARQPTGRVAPLPGRRRPAAP